MRYAAIHLTGKKAPVLSGGPNMMVNPFVELERYKNRPALRSTKPENPELTEHYKELDEEVGMQILFDRLKREKEEREGTFNEELHNQQERASKMLAARDYYETQGDKDLETSKKFIKEANKIKYEIALINEKIEQKFSPQKKKP